jgi:hypothetical protein
MKSDTLCYCGCGQYTNIASGNNLLIGVRKGEPHRWVAGHQRTFNNWTPVVWTDCWIWLGGINTSGYGQHVTVYERYVGPVPEGLELDHLCKNRLCVNPDHLEPVTRSENLRRKFPPMEHGTRRMYEAGCRESCCREYHNARMRRQRAARNAKVAACGAIIEGVDPS